MALVGVAGENGAVIAGASQRPGVKRVVGYGDFYPVTTLGRLISSLLIISGVSLFGVISVQLLVLKNRAFSVAF